MNDMAFLAGAFLVIWFASFAFIISMVQRQRNLEREISALRELTQERVDTTVHAQVNPAK